MSKLASLTRKPGSKNSVLSGSIPTRSNLASLDTQLNPITLKSNDLCQQMMPKWRCPIKRLATLAGDQIAGCLRRGLRDADADAVVRLHLPAIGRMRLANI